MIEKIDDKDSALLNNAYEYKQKADATYNFVVGHLRMVYGLTAADFIGVDGTIVRQQSPQLGLVNGNTTAAEGAARSTEHTTRNDGRVGTARESAESADRSSAGNEG